MYIYIHIFIHIYLYIYIYIHINMHIYIYVTGTEKGLGKEMIRFRLSVIFGFLAWMLVDVQMNHGSSVVHAHWFSH